MKNMMKRFICSLLIASLMCVSIGTSVFAADNVKAGVTGVLEIPHEADDLERRLNEMTYEELRTVLMEEFGATPEEATLLANYQMMGNVQTRTFPSNPEIGDVHKESFTVHVALDASVAALAVAIVSGSKYITLAKALTIASAILSVGSNVLGNTVRVTVNYTYGYTNDGVLGWTPGYFEYEIL